MRILHLINHCRFGHGNVHACIDLACCQADRGDTVALASAGGTFTPLLKQHGIAHFDLNQESRGLSAIAWGLVKLSRVLRHFGPDIIHVHMMTGAVYATIGGRICRIPTVSTVHNAFDGHAKLMNLTMRVIAVSNGARQTLERRGFDMNKVRVVRNGTVGVARREDRKREPAPLARASVTTICGLHSRKGVQDLIDAFSRVAVAVPHAHLYIVGDGPDKNKLRNHAAALACWNRIEFLGELRDPWPQLLATDVFVLASHADPGPLVVLEAREAGCAIVASDVDGIPEMLDDGRVGILVRPGDVPGLANAIQELLLDDDKRQRLRIAVTENLDRFHIHRVYAETRAVYAELTSAA
jgi:glycosyltransferase involved in cell wall biosynthesis